MFFWSGPSRFGRCCIDMYVSSGLGLHVLVEVSNRLEKSLD